MFGCVEIRCFMDSDDIHDESMNILDRWKKENPMGIIEYCLTLLATMVVLLLLPKGNRPRWKM